MFFRLSVRRRGPLKSAFTLFTWVLLFCLVGHSSGSLAAEKPDAQVLVEVGLAVPYGDLGQDYDSTALGFGARNGFEVGFRLRYYLTPSVSISPSIHLLNPSKDSLGNEETGEFFLQANSYRYSVEMMLAQPAPRRGIQPFLACGLGVFRDRYQGYKKPLAEEFDRSVNTLGISVRAGIRAKGLELSLVYHFNRFETSQFFGEDEVFDYNWDSMTIRLGWIIPFTTEEDKL